MTIKMSKKLQHNIFQHVEGTFPNEGGGFLLGTRTTEYTHVQDVIHIDNVFETEEQYHRYAMTPENWATMEDQADERGLTLIGYHHSHPNAPAIPSEFDRDHALPNFLYIITSVQAGEAADMRAWTLKADRTAFDANDLTITEGETK